jgi:hypothetical protein
MRTNPRVLAGLLVAAAGLLYLAITVPARRAAAEAQDAYGREREERQGLRSRLAERELTAAAEARATAAVAMAGTPGYPVGHLRRSVVASLEGAGVSGVRISVTPGRDPVAARLQLSAEGPYAEALRLTGRLVRPGSGLILETVRLRPSAAGLGIDVVGFSLAGRP